MLTATPQPPVYLSPRSRSPAAPPESRLADAPPESAAACRRQGKLHGPVKRSARALARRTPPYCRARRIARRPALAGSRRCLRYGEYPVRAADRSPDTPRQSVPQRKPYTSHLTIRDAPVPLGGAAAADVVP